MAVLVVYLFEIIYVDEKNSHMVVVAGRFSQLGFQRHLQESSVADLSKGVEQRQLLELIDPPFVGYMGRVVAEYFNSASDLAAIINHGKHFYGYWNAMSIAVVEIDLGFGAVAVFDSIFQRALSCTKVYTLLIYVGQEIIMTGSTQCTGTGVACEHFGAPVPVGDESVPINEINTVVEVLNKILVKRFVHYIRPGDTL